MNSLELIEFQQLEEIKVDDHFVSVVVKVHKIESVITQYEANNQNLSDGDHFFKMPKVQSSLVYLHVYDQSASIYLRLISLKKEKLQQIQEGSVITIVNGACILDENNHKVLIANDSSKYSKIEILNELSEEFSSEIQKNQNLIALALLNNKSMHSIKLKQI
ncbi:UNKNOWN [Stylonychia lemnae]|uniref:Uncharacterized protein n=1 Tax=Stylonychia lemnae TaxID=5949 RepID=A0A078A4C2_STYLE|nr:UNKNOWN [Stylonychia lemnae]|eukprot:CDW75614.1 UNKNOWN [Stylonychia lemnae]